MTRQQAWVPGILLPLAIFAPIWLWAFIAYHQGDDGALTPLIAIPSTLLVEVPLLYAFCRSVADE